VALAITATVPTSLPRHVSSPDFASVFQENLDYVWRVLRCLGVPSADVDDVCQEVFVVVHRRLPEYEARGTMRAWLYGIARRVWSDQRRRAWRQHERTVAELPDRPDAPGTGPGDRAEQRQSLDQLAATLAALPEEQRMTFLLYEVEQLTMAEIAAAMECPLQTGYTRLRAARAHVQRAFGNPADEHGGDR
jgi:RNA polymerase sigma-70 factor (ECF subfamily)